MSDDTGYIPAPRIAIIRPSALGDVCRTVPALVSLRHAYPDARIDWIVRDSFAPAIAEHPALDEAIHFPRSRFSRAGRSIETSRELWRWLRSLRERGYDMAYDLQGLARSGFMTWWTGARRRVGFADAREGAFMAYTDRIRVTRAAHTVDRMLAILEEDGVPIVRDMRLYPPRAATGWWIDHASAIGVDLEAPYAVLAPTARWVAKRWPAGRFASLINPLSARGVNQILVVGAPGEREQCARILEAPNGATGSRVIDLVGKTNVGQLMAIISRAALIVANDSAALHMAVGLQTPYIALFGPTDIAKVGPYRGDRWVLQRVEPDERLSHKDDSLGASIMERITVDAVLERIDERLGAPVVAADPIERTRRVAGGDDDGPA
ncbi:MAG: glycosyltransferase family 9 protein [Phycisphaerales bacterium]